MSIWSEPRYLGDMVRRIVLLRRGQIGVVCIQQYNNSVRVASFLPGKLIALTDDLMCIQPELAEWVGSQHRADELFDTYVGYAYDAFWQNEAEGHGGQRSGNNGIAGSG